MTTGALNHRDLLVRYMRHVISEEGASFLDSEHTGPLPFTADEIAEMRAVEQEARAPATRTSGEWLIIGPTEPPTATSRRGRDFRAR